ncbi:MAG TPA: type VI secretion system accessory protein TagJ [Steroidobacteraceae bacterium]
MSAAENLFREGDLTGSLHELENEIRRKPADAKLRIFLSQLLMVRGDWDRALNQLTVVGEMEASALPMMHTYQAAIQCERLRESVFNGERSPLIFGEPEPWIAQMVQALVLDGKGQSKEAAAMRAEAREAAPAVPGTLNGKPFEWVADADSRLGPILEVLLNSAYYWIPFSRIQRIVFEKPTDARDLVWLPAQFTWANGGEAMGLIPTRYAGSHRSEDDQIRLSRKTEWREIAPEEYAGLGQRLLTTNADELGLLEVRELTLETVGS